MNNRTFLMIGSSILLASVPILMVANARGFWVHLYQNWWSFAAFNIGTLVLLVPSLTSSRWLASEKRVLSTWLFFALWFEAISFSSGALRGVLYIVGFIIASVALIYAARVEPRQS